MAVKTLFLVSSILAASTLSAAAIEPLNPHDVLNKTRRDMNAFDQRMKGYKAEQQKKEKEAEAKRKNEELSDRRKREEGRESCPRRPTETRSRRTTQTREGGQGSAGGSEQAGCSSRKARPRGFALTSPDHPASILNRRIGTEFDESALKLTTHPQRLRGKAPAYVP